MWKHALLSTDTEYRYIIITAVCTVVVLNGFVYAVARRYSLCWTNVVRDSTVRNYSSRVGLAASVFDSDAAIDWNVQQ